MAEYMAAKMDDQISGAISENDRLRAELARLTDEVEALRVENNRLHAAIDRLRATFRANMLRHCASATHDEITRVLDAAEAGNG